MCTGELPGTALPPPSHTSWGYKQWSQTSSSPRNCNFSFYRFTNCELQNYLPKKFAPLIFFSRFCAKLRHILQEEKFGVGERGVTEGWCIGDSIMGTWTILVICFFRSAFFKFDQKKPKIWQNFLPNFYSCFSWHSWITSRCLWMARASTGLCAVISLPFPLLFLVYLFQFHSSL